MTHTDILCIVSGCALLVGPASADVLITEIVDGPLPGGLPKWVEVTNCGASPIDLSEYSLGVYADGSTLLSGNESVVLSGVLGAGDSFVVNFDDNDAPGASSFLTVYGVDPSHFGFGSAIDGNDVVALFQADGSGPNGAATGDGADATLLDVCGVIGVDGVGQEWESTDSYGVRTSGSASAVFDANAWFFPGADALEAGCASSDSCETSRLQSSTHPFTCISCAGLGTALCFGDGSTTNCPCGNLGGPGGGCASSTGHGARLSLVASSGQDIALRVSEAPPGARGLFFQGNLSTNPPPVFGDGLRCCGVSVLHMGAMIADGSGSACTNGAFGAAVNFDSPLHVACKGMVSAGDSRCYQFWYCDDGGSPCGFGFNLTNAVEFLWTPDAIVGSGDCTLSAGYSNPCDIELPVDVAHEPGPLSCPPSAPSACNACGVSPGMPITRGFSGEFQIVETDLALGGRGHEFRWQRQYRSRTGGEGSAGKGMTGGCEVGIVPEGSDLLLRDGQGRLDRYVLQPDGTWVAEEFPRVLRAVAGVAITSYVVEFEDGGRWELHGLDDSPSAGKLDRIVTRNGDATSMQYDGAGRLVGITDALSRSAGVQYDPSGRVSAVVDALGRSSTYVYYGPGDPDGPEGALASVTGPAVTGTPNGNDFPSGKTTSYTYSTGFGDERLNGDLRTITDPKGQTWLRNEYAHTIAPSDPRHTTDPADLHFDRIVRQFLGGPGDVTDYFYETVPPSAGNLFAVVVCIENDRVGNVTEMFYDARGREVIRREYTGRADPDQYTSSTVNRPTGKLRPSDPDFFETRTEYNEQSLPVRVVHPNGAETQHVYEIDLDPEAPAHTRGNLREVHRLPGPLGGSQPVISEYFEYDTGMGGCCGSNFITRHVDGNGNETVHEYDAAGNRIRTIHPIAGIEEEFEYNAHGQLTARVHPENGSGHRRRDELEYHTTGAQAGYLAASLVDATGLQLTTTYEYDDAGNVVRVVDPRGFDALYTYNQLDQVVREESREVVSGGGLRYVVDTFYDENDNVVRREVDNLDEDGQPMSPPRLVQTFEHEVLNFVVRETTDVDGSHEVASEFVYDANRNLVLARSPEAVAGKQPTNETATLYDERDLVFRVVHAPTDAGHSTTQFDYDANGNLAAVSSGLERSPRVTLHEYDGYDRLERTTDPMGNVRILVYDANRNRIGERNEGELVDVPGSSLNVRLSETIYAYDALDRLVREDAAHFDTLTQAPVGDGFRTTTTEYTPSSQVARRIDDHGHATELVYDGALRLSTATDAKGNVSTRAYDANSNPISTSTLERSDTGAPDQVFTTTYEYDGLDRLTRTTDNLGNAREMRYDSRGNKVLEIDEAGREVRSIFDGLDRLVAKIIDLDGDGALVGDAADIVVGSAYDDNSRMVGQADDNGNTTSYVYDALDRRIRTAFADGTEESVSHDVHDDVVEMLDANGSLETLVHDLLGRKTQGSVQPGPGVSVDTTFEEYGYDGLSRLVRAEDDDSLVTRVHDSLSNVVVEDQDGAVVQSTFDALGNKLQCVYPGGRTVARTYDELDRQKVLSDQQGVLAVFDYVGTRRLERREQGNGTRVEFTYDALRRVLRTRHTLQPRGSVVDERTYAWDAVGNLVRREDLRPGGPGIAHDYVYDRANRLVQTQVEGPLGNAMREATHALDGVLNRTSVSERRAVAGTLAARPWTALYSMAATTPEPADLPMNQYTATPFDRRHYDAAANLIELVPPSGAKVQVSYDARNRMVGFLRAPLQVSYRYDALGRRIGKTVDDGRAVVTRRFLYDDWQEIEEWDGADVSLATWVYGGFVDEPITMRRDGSDAYYHADGRHNVMALTDGFGVVVERYEFGDFGQVVDPITLLPESGAPSALGNPLLFGGRRYDEESTWYYYRTRYMEPDTGRFTSRDTIGIWGDASNLGNGTVYPVANPWSRLDPFGLGMWDWIDPEGTPCLTMKDGVKGRGEILQTDAGAGLRRVSSGEWSNAVQALKLMAAALKASGKLKCGKDAEFDEAMQAELVKAYMKILGEGVKHAAGQIAKMEELLKHNEGLVFYFDVRWCDGKCEKYGRFRCSKLTPEGLEDPFGFRPADLLEMASGMSKCEAEVLRRLQAQEYPPAKSDWGTFGRYGQDQDISVIP